MYALDIASSKFQGLSVVKQHRLVNEVLGEDIKNMHGIQLRTRAIWDFTVVVSTLNARSNLPDKTVWKNVRKLPAEPMLELVCHLNNGTSLEDLSSILCRKSFNKWSAQAVNVLIVDPFARQPQKRFHESRSCLGSLPLTASHWTWE
jgi:hypothetical protein